MKFEVDFKTAVSEANKAGKAIQSAFEKASSEGIAGRAFSVGLRKNIALAKKLTDDLDKKRREIEKRADFAEKNAAQDLAKYKAELESNLAKKKAALQKEADEERKAALKEEISEVQKLVQLSDELNKDAKAFAANTNKMVAGLHKAGQDGQKLQKNIENSAKAAKEIADAFDDLIDPSKISEKMEGMAENIGEAFKNGIDVQSLSKDLGKGLSKAITVAGKSLGSGSGAMMAATGAIAGIVAALGILVAAFIAVDKKVKDFNKGVIKTHGALSLANVGGKDLAKGLTIVRHAVQDLSANMGVAESDALALFDTLDRGGITLERLTRGATTMAAAQGKLNQSLREMHSIANLMGVSLTEYAENLTNYVDDLAMSTNTVNESFAEIADMASRAGFGTRRFYSMVVQATSGQSSLNVRLEQTGDLLMRMSKIMGMKKATEMLGGSANRMADASAQDRARHLIIAGGQGQEVYRREALTQASNFARANTGNQAALSAAITSARLPEKLANSFRDAMNNPEGLVRALSSLQGRDRRSLLTEIRAQGTPESDALARQVEGLIDISQGAQGGLDARVRSADQLSAGGNLAIEMREVQRILRGRDWGQLSTPERAAMENISGRTGRSTTSLIQMEQASRGEFEAIRRGSAGGMKLREQYGLRVTADGRVFDRVGTEIRDGIDLLQTQGNMDAQHSEHLVDEATSVAYQTMDATVSIADILENQVMNALTGIYETINSFLGSFLRAPFMSADRERFEKKQAAMTAIQDQIKRLSEQSTSRSQAISRANATISNKNASAAEKTAARTVRDRLVAEQRQASEQIRNLRETGSRIRAGEVQRSTEFRIGYAHQGGGVMEARDEANRRGISGGLRTLMGHTFSSREEAESYARRIGQFRGASGNMRNLLEVQDVSRELTPQEIVAQAMRTGTVTPAAGTAAPAAAPAAAAPAAAATPAAGAAPAVSVAPPTPQVAERQAAPAVAATESAASEQARRDQRALQTANRQHDQLIGQLKGRALGDALADSRLPQAIAVADAKMRLLESLYAGGASTLPAEQINRLLAGTATPEDLGAAGAAGQQARALQFMSAPPVQDFVYQDRGGRSVITPISREDQVTGAKPGGPIAAAATRPGGNVVVHIHGGDERRIFDVVKRAIIGAGITPNRVPGVT